MNTEADVIWVDGHSDYGHAFQVFWDEWGRDSGNPKCQNCMVHSGWEASAVNDHFASPGKSLRTVLAG